MGNLLARFETNLIDLEVVFIDQIGKTALLFLEDLFLLQIDDVHKNLLFSRSGAEATPPWSVDSLPPREEDARDGIFNPDLAKRGRGLS